MHAVQKILGEGTHPDDYVSPHGTTALLRAVETGQAKVVAALLEAGASPSVRNEMGEEHRSRSAKATRPEPEPEPEPEPRAGAGAGGGGPPMRRSSARVCDGWHR